MSGLTYPEVGATQILPLPPGYDHLERHARLGTGADAFRVAADALARWQPQRGAGLIVRTDADRPEVGVRFETGLGAGPLRIWAPCEVVWVLDEPDRYGFGFGTLDGHPEIGEEAFTVSRNDADEVWFDVRAFSRPGPWWARLGQPAARFVQLRVTQRYVRAMRIAVQ